MRGMRSRKILAAALLDGLFEHPIICYLHGRKLLWFRRIAAPTQLLISGDDEAA